MRQRVEDLGRIAAILESLMDQHELFHLIQCREKDFVDHFEEMSEDKKEDLLHSLAYGISHLKNILYDVLIIAQGRDELNEELGIK